jgi:endonuclease/exonuclease/phosphatase (EEP) superfamily protein YafD
MSGGGETPADPGRVESSRPGRRPRARILLTVLSLLYAAATVGLCLLLYLASDRWWPATLLLFLPRWPWALPLAVLLPAAAWRCRRLLWLLAPVLVLVLVGLLGLCLPWQASWGPCPHGHDLRVLTCNVHRHDLDPAALGVLIAATDPDIVALQGWSSGPERRVFAQGDWHAARAGQLLLASRYPIRQVEGLDDPDFTGGDYAIARGEVDAPCGTVAVVTLHLSSPRDGLEEAGESHGARVETLEANSALRRRQSAKAARWLEGSTAPLLIVGDFNTPTESTIYQQYWSPYTNAFSASGFGFGTTFFTRRAGVRIDHVLTGPGWRCRRCWVGPSVGSPHHPVLADLCRDDTPGR